MKPPAFLLVLVLLISRPALCPGADRFLTIAGGYSPAGNQVSLELNVIFYRKLLAEAHVPAGAQSLFFADGNDKAARDVQFSPVEDTVPPANRLMALLFGTDKYLDLDYRDHRLPNVENMVSQENLEAWFKTEGAKLKAGDRLVIYVTAHGTTPADAKKEPRNTRLYLWNRRTVDVKSFAGWLDLLPKDVSVVLVMAQCHAGGFANAIFQEGSEMKPRRDRSICGFFATTHDRVAAGCTPDISEANYQDYSSPFWAALRGQTRLDQPLEKPDFDANGQVSFAEAHAHAMITAKTADLPIKTSGVFLRARSRLASQDEPNLIGTNLPYSEVLTLAAPVDKRVLEALSKQLHLSGENRFKTSTDQAASLQSQREELGKQDRERKTRQDAARGKLQEGLRRRWPELNNLLSAGTVRLLTEDADEFVKTAEGLPDYAEWKNLGSERKRIDQERFEKEKQWILHQRFLRTYEEVILAANLFNVSGEDAVKEYYGLLDAENGGLARDGAKD